MYRKFVAPLSKRSILNLIKLYVKTPEQFAVFDDFEFSLGQLYKLGIVEIKKQLEYGKFIMFISLTEVGKELFKQSEFSMKPAF